MPDFKRALDVSPRAAWATTFFAVFGLVFLAANEQGLTWPNPFRAPVEAKAPATEKIIEEEALTESLDDLDEALDSELEALATTPAALPLPVVPAPVAVEDAPVLEGQAPPTVEELDGLVAALEELVEDDSRLAAAGDLPAGALAKALNDSRLAEALDKIPPIQENCRLGTAEKCRIYGLDGFFQRLDMVQMGQKVRLAAFGDSLIMGDQVVGALRRRLQDKFGNAGPGFFMPAKPARWYSVAGAVVYGSEGWKVHRITEPHIGDRLYGYGAQTFVASAAGEDSHIECDSRCPWDDITSYEVYYLSHEKGGKFTVSVSKGAEAEVDTKSGQKASGYYSAKSAAGPLDIKLASKDGGVRLFGVVAENDKPGAVLDSLGILGATAVGMNQNDSDHFAEQIRHRSVDLAILFFGTNESEARIVDDAYKKGYKRFIETIRKGNPNISILMVSPPARGQKTASGVTLRPNIEKLVRLQEEIARENGCAFWSAFDAMGGKDGPQLWFEHKPAFLGNDLTHFTKAGATHMGKIIYASLVRSYIEYRKR